MLNVSCSQADFSLENKVLPLYLELYELLLAKISDINVLFIAPKKTFPDVNAIKKHIEKIQDMTGYFVALYLEDISEARKRNLIENHIPFVVNNSQIYLPFMAVCLQDKLKDKKEVAERFTPATQLLFLYFFNQNSKELPAAGFGAKFNFSEMTTTRALRQLESTGLFDIKKSSIKNSNILACKILDKKELFGKIEQYLINPVKKYFYIDKKEVKNEQLFPSGDTYLSKFSMIENDKIDVWGFCGKQSDFKTASKELLDATKQSKIEMWKYDPKLTGSTSENEPISVYLSFKDCTDERINKEKKELIDKAIRDSNAYSWS